MTTHRRRERILPTTPMARVMHPVERFLHVQTASGGVLLLCALFALAMANSPYREAYQGFWQTPVGLRLGDWRLEYSLLTWINDGLMAIFFFVVGLEVKREMVRGELRQPRQAALPVAAAIGGMIVPAALYWLLQRGAPGERGWGIPMATDIAFVVGAMAILADRIPRSLRVMLLTLAIVDDIGAILVIAIGYSDGLEGAWLLASVGGVALVAVLARLGLRSILVYTVLGAGIWFACHESGIHATIAGVVLGLMTPATSYLSSTAIGKLVDRADDFFRGDLEEEEERATEVRYLQNAVRESISPLEYIENALHPWVGFVIMPIFALANAGVALDFSAAASPISLAVIVGLVVGKPLGILVFSYLAIRVGLARFPDTMTVRHLAGGGCLAGIGFTMALFIASLALEGPLLAQAKVGILIASVIATTLGMAMLWFGPTSDSRGAGESPR
jgi:NhaA family Na+:H+ antiporter